MSTAKKLRLVPHFLWLWAFCTKALVASTPVHIQQVQTFDKATCALLSDGRVTCWGNPFGGFLGIGEVVDKENLLSERKKLLAVDLGESAIQISAHLQHVCAVLKSGRVKCWGSNQSFQLGISDKNARGAFKDQMGQQLPAVKIPLDEKAIQVAVGNNFSIALTQHAQSKRRSVWVWGGMFGEQNQKPAQPHPEPRRLIFWGDHEPSFIAAGGGTACAILKGGGVVCWGSNTYGQLGQGHTSAMAYSGFENEVGAISEIDLGKDETGNKLLTQEISMGQHHVCAQLSNAKIKCWGSNRLGQLGGKVPVTENLGDSPKEMGNNLPYLPLGEGETAKSLTVLLDSTCAILYNGTARCWGKDYDRLDNFEFNEGDRDEGFFETQLIGSPQGAAQWQGGFNLPFGPLAEVVSISGSEYHACAILKPAKLTCWGIDLDGSTGLVDSDGAYAVSIRLKTRPTKFPRYVVLSKEFSP